MKINDFLSYDLNDLVIMSDADLRAVAAGGRKAANQRITRLKQAHSTSSPAYQVLPKKVRADGFTTAGKSRNELIKTISAEQQFLRAKTSTVSGYNKLKSKAFEGQTAGRIGYDVSGKPVRLRPGEKSAISPKQINRYWELRGKAKEMWDGIKGIEKYESVIGGEIATLLKEHPRMSMQNLEKLLNEKVAAYYEKNEETYNSIISGRKGKTFYK